MKLYQFIISAITAFTLFSCSAEDNNGLDKPIVPAGEPATLKLTITDPMTRTRAAGDIGPDSTTLNNLTIFIFRADGLSDIKPLYINKSELKKDINITVTTAAQEVFVIANTADSLITNRIGSKDQLIKESGNLMHNQDGFYETTQNATNLYMSGNRSITWGNDNVAEVTIPLSLLAAKVEVVVDLTSFNNPVGANRINIRDLVVLFAGADVKYFNDNGERRNFYTGTQEYTIPTQLGDSIVDVSGSDELRESVSFNGDGSMQTTNPHFYILPNNANSLPTIIALRGTRTNSGVITNYYWPVKFVSVKAGVNYKLLIKLTGTTSDGSEGGSTLNPEKDITRGAMETNIVFPSWIQEDKVQDEWK